MAAIGFKLEELLRKQSYFGLMRAYGYAGLISSGPWVLSILVIMALGYASINLGGPGRYQQVTEFLVSVTYLVAATLTVSGLAQLIFTRFVADRIFERRTNLILPNLIGMLSVINVVAVACALPIALFLFEATSLLYRLEMGMGFVILANVWCVTVLISGMKAYGQLLTAFATGFGLTFVLGLALRGYGLVGLLGGFVVGQAVLLYLVLFIVVRHHPGERLAEFDFCRGGLTHRSLIATGLVYNAAIWADKVLFWYHPATSIDVIGPLRAAPIYDLPIFLAYLSIIPGMAIFLMRIEIDFARAYQRYFDAVRSGGSLENVEQQLDDMIDATRQCLYDILKIQGITIVILILLARQIMGFFGFPAYYVPIFIIDIIAVGMQLLLMVVLNVMFYLDKLGKALFICCLFLASNIVFTSITLVLGYDFYGYGFAGSLLLTSMVALALLSREFKMLTYRTFMLQPNA